MAAEILCGVNHDMSTPTEFPGMVAHALQCVARVDSVRHMARDTWAVRLQAPELASRITPGQFFMLRPTVGTDPLLGRPFALYDVYHDAQGQALGIEFGFVKIGKMTGLMSEWQAGDSVSVWGPLGNGFPVPDCKRLVMVAGGIGQTPFLAVAREALRLAHYGRKISDKLQSAILCYGTRSNEYLAGLDDFQMPGLEVRVATDDGSFGHAGFVTDLLKHELSSGTTDTHVYCCGPEPMMKVVAEICQRAATPCWLSLETPMACGFGACFSCVARVREADGSWDYRRTCVEGPVFPAERLVL